MIAEVESMIKVKSINPKEIHAIILLVENSNFHSFDKPYYEKICGRSMHSYLENICFDFKRTLAVLEENAGLENVVKGYIDNSPITLVLFSDTPLLSREVLDGYINKFLISNDDYLVMPRGFIFKTEYIEICQKIEVINKNMFEKSDFFQVSSLQDLESATRFMQNKILNYHLSTGVKIVDKQTTKIDADVDISRGTIIKPFCQILGKTIIGYNCEINSSILEDCKVEDNCCIENCNLKKCRVIKNERLKPFTFAKGKDLKGVK